MTESTPTGLPDRGSWLVAFGVVEILMSAICVLFVFLLAASVLLTSTLHYEAGPPAAQALLSVFFYLALAGFFGAIGYGTLRGLRWARSLMLVFSWFWLVGGALGMIFIVLMMPQIFETISHQQGRQMPPGAMEAVKFLTIGFSAVLYVMLPGSFVAFYMSPSVAATFEARDSKRYWTDRCPLPVLGLALLMGFGAVGMFFSALCYNGAFPFFGLILSGIAGMLVMTLFAVFWGACGWLIYRVRPAGWWGGLAVYLVMILSSTITFANGDMGEYFRHMGFAEQQLKLLESMKFFQGDHMTAWMLLSSLPLVGYFLWVRKYFSTKSQNDSKI